MGEQRKNVLAQKQAIEEKLGSQQRQIAEEDGRLILKVLVRLVLAGFSFWMVWTQFQSLPLAIFAAVVILCGGFFFIFRG